MIKLQDQLFIQPENSNGESPSLQCDCLSIKDQAKKINYFL